VKKWIITILAALAFLALALTANAWTPWLLSFVVQNKEKIESLNTSAELISKLVMWPASAVLFIFGLWQRKQEANAKQPPTVNLQGSSVAGDVNNASAVTKIGVDAHAERDLSVGGDLVNQKTVIYQTTPLISSQPILSPLHQLPPPPADFTGRATELRELRAAIEQGGIHISGLHGQGGVGKTALALKLADELAPKFPDAQIYLDLKGVSDRPLTAVEAMSHVLRTFHPEAKLPEKEEDLRPLYNSVLHGKSALLLMDNAKDATQVRPLIPPQGCALLVTSRSYFHLPGLQPKNLDILPPLDANDFLVKIAPRIKNEAQAIAKLCGYLPQALRLAATAIAERKDVSPATYREKLADEKQRLGRLGGGQEGIEASIKLSYRLLDSQTKKRWRMLGVFPDTFDLSAAATVLDLETDPTQDILSDLLKFSMLEWNETTNRYRLHDLMRAFVRGQLSAAESHAAAIQHARHYLDVIIRACALYARGERFLIHGLAVFDLEWENIQAGHAWAAAHSIKDRYAAKLCKDYPDQGLYILSLRQGPHEQIRWCEAALAVDRQLGDPAAERRHLSDLGLAYDLLGDSPRALECYRQSLAIAREMGDRLGERTALINLGSTYSSLGDSGLALDYGERSMDIARELGDKQAQGDAFGNLGNVYYSLGEIQRALEYYERQLEIACAIANQRGKGDALGNLGNAYYTLGETGRALQYYEQQLEITRDIGDRRREGNALWNMSLALDKSGCRKEAVKHALVALRTFEEIESPNAGKVRKQVDIWQGDDNRDRI
jgi:tetratricopeptide (TPR) repeat protein